MLPSCFLMALPKAVFPVAGLGTRTLPATKALAKEMLPLVDKPVIQYAVEEAISAGIKEMIFVTAASKQIIENHFSQDLPLERALAERGEAGLLHSVQNLLPDDVACQYVVQEAPLGLGHAVLCAKELVGDEPFAVLLPDDLIFHHGQSCLQQMLALYQTVGASVIAVKNVARRDTSKYGIVEIDDSDAEHKKLKSVVEKPAPAVAPSTLAIVGRYILTPRIMALLAHTGRGAGNEIQLTDAIAALLREEEIYLCEFVGERSDCGSILGYMQATVEYAIRHKQIGADFRDFLRGLDLRG